MSSPDDELGSNAIDNKVMGIAEDEAPVSANQSLEIESLAEQRELLTKNEMVVNGEEKEVVFIALNFTLIPNKKILYRCGFLHQSHYKIHTPNSTSKFYTRKILQRQTQTTKIPQFFERLKFILF